MISLSLLASVLGGLTGGVGGAWLRQKRIGRALTPESASLWDELGFLGKQGAQRDVRRGRVPDDPSEAALAAELAAVLRRDTSRRSLLGVLVALIILFTAVAVFAAAAGEWVMTAFLGLCAATLAVILVCQPTLARKLEGVERQARARAAYER